MRILQMVPRMAPSIDGVGDYALGLARTLRERSGIDTQFIVADPHWEGRGEVDGFSVCKIRPQSGVDVKNLGAASALLLHYVGYGYQKRGVPVWLLKTLDHLKQGPKLVTLFHEVWASGPPWSSVFYLGPWQKWVAMQILKRSQKAVTNTVRMKKLLEKDSSGNLELLPISSPFSWKEPADKNIFQKKEGLRVLIFGQKGARFAALHAHEELLKTLSGGNLLQTVVVVGKGSGTAQMLSLDAKKLRRLVPVEKIHLLGEASASEVVQEFKKCDFYLSSCPGSLLCKSTAVMTSMAFGCPVVVKDGKDAFPLEEGRHFMACDGSQESAWHLMESIRNQTLNRIGEEGRNWYRENADWDVVVKKWETILQT